MEHFTDIFDIRKPVNSELLQTKRLELGKAYMLASEVWQYLDTYSHDSEPARFLMWRWSKSMMTLLKTLAPCGGLPDGSKPFTSILDAEREVMWGTDLDSPMPGVELVGDILYACFEHTKVYENESANMRFYFARTKFDDLQNSVITYVKSVQHVTVFQQGEDAYVAVRVINPVEGHHVNPWTYFARIETKNLIFMLQPNNTEIFEGRVKRYRLAQDGGSDLWLVVVVFIYFN